MNIFAGIARKPMPTKTAAAGASATTGRMELTYVTRVSNGMAGKTMLLSISRTGKLGMDIYPPAPPM